MVDVENVEFAATGDTDKAVNMSLVEKGQSNLSVAYVKCTINLITLSFSISNSKWILIILLKTV